LVKSVKYIKFIAFFALAGLAAALLFLFDPAQIRALPLCPFRALTGLDCPGCGALRASHQILHGNLAAAFRLNPLVILFLPFLGYYLFRYCFAALSGKPYTEAVVRPVFIWMLLAVIILFWALRNTPLYPFFCPVNP